MSDRQASPERVCVAHGFAVRVSVDRGRLVVRDGIGRAPRTRTYGRATHRLKRLVLVGHRGFISLDAVRWLADVGVGYVQIDSDGRILSASTGLGLDDPRLRRAQAISWGTPIGMAVARMLLERKLAGQLQVARSLPAGEEVWRTIEQAQPLLRLATTPAELMVPEAAAALAYWSAWSAVELRWARADAVRIPDGWRTFGSRASPLTGNPRLAGNPANALLNYLYALLEAEARLACLAMGLDPGLGVLHVDQRGRDSLALDVMEAVRPEVDAFVLELIERRTFRRTDFFETRQGVCRILAPLTVELAGTIPVWSARLGPVVEAVAKGLLADSRELGRTPTPLTGANRSAGRAGVRRASTHSAVRPVSAARSCSWCGGAVATGRRTCSDDCQMAAQAAQDISGFIGSGPARLRELAAKGYDPARSPTAKSKLRGSQSRRRREAIAWDLQDARPDPIEYSEQILPLVRRLTVGEITRATGLGLAHSARIRRGESIPHPRWWRALRAASRTGSSESLSR